MNNSLYDNEADITCTDNGNVVTAEIDDFRLEDSLNAFIATNKIHMKWNGSVYVGNAFGMEFTTKGPRYLGKIK
jgi:hypothetical protein